MFLIKNAKNIDIIQFYHYNKISQIVAFVYKLLNPKGFVYVKLDARGIVIVDEIKYDYFVKNIFDLFSVETANVFNALSNGCFKLAPDKLLHAANGIDCTWMRRNGFMDTVKEDKENLIITVGNIGQDAKNNGMMLKALSGMDLGDWKFMFIGPIEQSFQSEIENFFSLNQQLEGKVIFTGIIHDRKELYFWYKKAKVFCLTSKWESWCFALSDSLYFGCEIICTSGVNSFDDLTDKNDFGYKIQNAEELRDILKKIIDGLIDPCASMEKIIAHGKRFDWTEICGKLDKRFNNIQDAG
jgi:glycosyltransferase involved in cell wall biosynthesis